MQVENQGDNEETQVAGDRHRRPAARRSRKTGTIPRIAAGETGTATIPLGQPPSTDGTSTVKVDVAPVPGEGTKDNNTAEYQVAFTS